MRSLRLRAVHASTRLCQPPYCHVIAEKQQVSVGLRVKDLRSPRASSTACRALVFVDASTRAVRWVTLLAISANTLRGRSSSTAAAAGSVQLPLSFSAPLERLHAAIAAAAAATSVGSMACRLLKAVEVRGPAHQQPVPNFVSSSTVASWTQVPSDSIGKGCFPLLAAPNFLQLVCVSARLQQAKHPLGCKRTVAHHE